ncbi:MAG TPA: hypothetical protein VN643_18785 [Pyrinomonadaceae bacterium]|nr:hypothetical protein [Pyrinomonadaceae bacterium]
MEKANKVTVSLAIILLVCFFLPWVQVSCGAEKDTATGLDLARDGDTALWLIPVLAIVLAVCGLRLLKIDQRIFGLITILSGLVSVYLLNHERSKFTDNSGLIEARLTPGFWLALIAAIATTVTGAFSLLRRRQE